MSIPNWKELSKNVPQGVKEEVLLCFLGGSFDIMSSTFINIIAGGAGGVMATDGAVVTVSFVCVMSGKERQRKRRE